MFCSIVRLFVVALIVSSAGLSSNAQGLEQAMNKPGVLTAPMAGSVVGLVTAPGLTNAGGLRITLRGVAGAASDTLAQLTGANGGFVFYNVPPGTYSVLIDAATIPAKYRLQAPASIGVEARKRSETTLTLEPRRSIAGYAFTDVDRDGVYTPRKDIAVAGAEVSINGNFAVSGVDGRFRFDDLPAGRMSMVVRWPGGDQTTHVVLDLGEGPVTDRAVNLPRYR